jgi:hypothetical protein
MLTHVDATVRSIPVSNPLRPRSTLAMLSLLNAAALEVMFRSAEAVRLDALQGHPRGRVLAIPGWDEGRISGILRAIHESSLWPWEGKSFASARGASEGVGTNRVRLPLLRSAFRFRTYETSSVVDGRPCFAIDYDVPTNPARARLVYDEVRSVDVGLFLGRGMRRRPGREPKLVLWFALDTSIQDQPVALRT